jgi:lysophospholipase L1-like esterase
VFLKVDKVIPLSFNQQPIDALNARIDAWAAGLNSTESPIWIADCSVQAGFTTGMLSDGVHPNAQGDEFIARVVGPLVVSAIEQVIAESL